MHKAVLADLRYRRKFPKLGRVALAYFFAQHMKKARKLRAFLILRVET
jgi:hypothetical protein